MTFWGPTGGSHFFKPLTRLGNLGWWRERRACHLSTISECYAERVPPQDPQKPQETRTWGPTKIMPFSLVMLCIALAFVSGFSFGFDFGKTIAARELAPVLRGPL